ncbi:MAG: UDP-N-acetylmuramoyl-L-alanine--D-glutamate ligase [Moraxellaceae bacterium]|nr:UDP-N-acetylmuramoyl-L-alanine--D-glutamate ligase [Moraxellaceae bacterium]
MTNSTQQNSNLQVVIGLGQSGLATANYLVKQGYQVAVTDGNPLPKLAEQLPQEIKIRKFGDIDSELLLKANRIIISPGIALEQSAVSQAIQANIPVISDIQVFHEELSKRDKKVPIVAITGSNAKSTVTTLVGEMAKNAGVNVGVGGNIGVPALTLLDDKNMELAVLELSSFQLETVTDLNAQVATILNLSPDHLDRHGSIENYLAEKQRIFQGVKSVVVNRDDKLTQPNIAVEKQISFGSDIPQDDNYGLLTENGEVYLVKGSKKLLNSNELKIKGQHNQLNILSALALGKLVDLPMKSMLATCRKFAGLPHRCQFIKNINGIDYFNDSKGTNIGSTISAIKGLGESYSASDKNSKIVLILGGQGKGQDFSEMVNLINQFVSDIYFIGEDGKLIEQQLTSNGLLQEIHCQQSETLDNAMSAISKLDDPNIKAILLSPACASLDQFVNYAKRGDRFIELVGELVV